MLRSAALPFERSRSEEHTSELQSPCNLVCRLLLEKKKATGVRFPIEVAGVGVQLANDGGLMGLECAVLRRGKLLSLQTHHHQLVVRRVVRDPVYAERVRTSRAETGGVAQWAGVLDSRVPARHLNGI